MMGLIVQYQIFFDKKIKNTYKGWNFDKVVDNSKHIAALTVYHILENNY